LSLPLDISKDLMQQHFCWLEYSGSETLLLPSTGSASVLTASHRSPTGIHKPLSPLRAWVSIMELAQPKARALVLQEHCRLAENTPWCSCLCCCFPRIFSASATLSQTSCPKLVCPRLLCPRLLCQLPSVPLNDRVLFCWSCSQHPPQQKT